MHFDLINNLYWPAAIIEKISHEFMPYLSSLRICQRDKLHELVGIQTVFLSKKLRLQRFGNAMLDGIADQLALVLQTHFLHKVGLMGADGFGRKI